MARQPGPIRPRVTDARNVDRMMRREYLVPMLGRLQKELAGIRSGTDAYYVIRQRVREFQARVHAGVPVEKLLAYFQGLEVWHRKRLVSTWQAAVGVDIRPFLSSPAASAFMTERLGESVGLIKTIPNRFLADVEKDLAKQLARGPFDQDALMKVFKDRYGSAGFNLRRLTRDQTNKAIGGLNQIRQTQIGVTAYKWMDAGDRRVRATHRENNGKIFEWGRPPATGHPGWEIMCRCVPLAVVTQANKERLGGS